MYIKDLSAKAFFKLIKLQNNDDNSITYEYRTP